MTTTAIRQSVLALAIVTLPVILHAGRVLVLGHETAFRFGIGLSHAPVLVLSYGTHFLLAGYFLVCSFMLRRWQSAGGEVSFCSGYVMWTSIAALFFGVSYVALFLLDHELAVQNYSVIHLPYAMMDLESQPEYWVLLGHALPSIALGVYGMTAWSLHHSKKGSGSPGS